MTGEHQDLVQLSDLSLVTQQSTRLNQVSLTLKKGEIVALIGRSGAGKSSLFSALLGLAQGHLSGTLNWQGQHLAWQHLAHLRGRAIALVPQGLSDALNPHSTIMALVMETLRLHQRVSRKACRVKAQHALLQGGVPEQLFYRYPRHLSGGEVQRVLMVLATLQSPSLLLLDEPSAALDAQSKMQLAQRLRQLKGQSSMLLVSHDLPWLRGLADRVVVMEQGRIIEEQACAAFFTAPKHASSRALIADAQPFTQSPAAGAAPLLSMTGLSHSFAAQRLFSDLNWQIKQAERWVVEGPSGVGKSTLARILSGWLPVQAGRLDWHGSESADSLLQRAVYIPQHPYASFSPHLTVARILSEPLRLRAVQETQAQLQQRLASVRLPSTAEFLKRLPHTLSGGEQQRLALARGLSLMPQLLVADEPTSALDPLSKQVFLQVLLTLQAQHRFALIVVSHDTQMAAELQAQRFILAQNG